LQSHKHVGHRGRQGLVKAHLTNKEELSYEKESTMRLISLVCVDTKVL